MSQLDLVVMPISEGRYFDRTYEFIVPSLWNALPPQLKNLTECNAVKKETEKVVSVKFVMLFLLTHLCLLFTTHT
jgi:hypothetical protein